MPIFRTSNFTLRPPRPSDVSSVVRHAHDREINRNTVSVPYPYRPKDARDWISKTQMRWRERPLRHAVFAIVVNGKAVGAIGLHKIIPGHKAELGYWLSREFRGQGIMTEAVRLIVAYGWKLKLRRIYAFTFLWNQSSQRVLVKAGFKHEGTLRKNVQKGRRLYDDHIFSVVR